MNLHTFDIDSFLRDYWQKKPLLIRNAFSAWENPLDPDDLAGLACEDDVEARLIVKTSDSWTLENGPFPETRFATLGDTPWTLLVQAVDHQVPDVAALLTPFRFIPNWRIDDVMVSYASDGGGVGPHFDNYDVFLVQGLGKRRWQIGALCDESTQTLPHADLRLLAHFEAIEEWVLEPGDILYVPPGIAHNGVAVGDDCMTYSVGFRAPSRHDLIAEWSDDVLDRLTDDDRYRDVAAPVQDNPGEITAPAIDALYAMMSEAMLDRNAFARWFGTYNSMPKYPEVDWEPEESIDVAAVRAYLDDGLSLTRNPASRFSFIRQPGDRNILFVDGESFECDGNAATWAEAICDQDLIETTDLSSSEAVRTLLAQLINKGSLAFDLK